MKLLIITLAILLLYGCSSTSTFEVRSIRNLDDVPKYIVNSTYTFDWTYCGKTDHREVLIKRNSGEYRSQDDSLRHKLPFKWYKQKWFKVRSYILDIPKGIKPGEKMILKNGKFIIKPKSPTYNLENQLFQKVKPR